MLYFALPGITVFFIVLLFCARDGLFGSGGTIGGLVKQPQNLSMLPVQSIIGLALTTIGFIIPISGQVTLGRNYSSTVVIRKDHQLTTHGI